MSTYLHETSYGVVGGTAVVSILVSTDPSDTLKAIRETLCRAQVALAEVQGDGHWIDIERIQRLIADIDRQRPLGADGTHGDHHTPTCGCVDR